MYFPALSFSLVVVCLCSLVLDANPSLHQILVWIDGESLLLEGCLPRRLLVLGRDVAVAVGLRAVECVLPG